MKHFAAKYKFLVLGVMLGAGYALFTRLVFGASNTLASLHYLFLVPGALGVIPLLFCNEEQLKSYRNIIFLPWLSLLTFFMLVVWLSLEDLICLIILGAPFFALVTIVAFIVRLVLIYRQRHKDKLLSILLLPFLAAPLENMLNSPISENRVETMITIEAPPHLVWEKIIRVDEISPDEYKSGLFNQLGIPRPISATLNEEKRGGVRTGHFWGGLKFTEVITVWQPHREVAFTIAVDNATIGKQIFQRHVLGGNYFKFLNARYRLKENQDGSTSLVLTSGYRLTSKVNFYGKFWGDWMLKDFQKRLLAVIKARCERFSNIDSK